MKKVLIITYYWPPGGGAGVQRWLKFVKYLPGNGWTPVVYTPENGEMPVIDESLLKDIPLGTEVLKSKIWEPYSIYKLLVGAGKGEKINTGFLTENKRPGFAEKLSVWLRGNFFIPDARCYWINPSVKYLTKWLQQNKIDVIVSTGPPHSMHLIAKPLAKKFNIPWIADFRDPWTNIDFYKDLMLSNAADLKHHRLEREVVTGADKVVVVCPGMKVEFETAHSRNIDLITNGYDEDDIVADVVPSKDKFVITHVGTLVRSRNPDALWKALEQLVINNLTFAERLSIRLIGKIDLQVKVAISRYNLDSFVTYVDYLPHDKVAAEQQSAAMLLLILNNTPNAKAILTGKLFEYMAAQRPILCIGPVDGDAAEIIRETETGKTFDFEDMEGIQNYIMENYNGSGNEIYSKGVLQYSRKALTGKLAGLLNSLSSRDS